MKKVFLLVLVLVSAKVFSQPVVQRSSGVNTVNDPNWMASRNAILPRYNDTAAANTAFSQGLRLDSSGAVIYTYDIMGFWFRQHNPKKWVQFSSGSLPTIYSSDGTLSSNRTVTGGGYSLTFTGQNNINLKPTGKIYFGDYSYYAQDSGTWYIVGSKDTADGGGTPWFATHPNGHGIKTVIYDQVQLVQKNNSSAGLSIRSNVEAAFNGRTSGLSLKLSQGTMANPMGVSAGRTVGVIEAQPFYPERATSPVNEGFNGIAAITFKTSDTSIYGTRGSGVIEFSNVHYGTTGFSYNDRKWSIGGRGYFTNKPTGYGTAYIHLKASDGDTSTAPIKIDEGTLLSVPEDGAVEYGSDHFYATIGSTRYQLDQQVPYISSTLTQPTLVTAGTAGTGTIVVTAGGTSVTGTNTLFSETFNIGDAITANGETQTITAISSNTAMTTTAWTNAASGVSYTLTGGNKFTVYQNGKVVLGTAIGLTAANRWVQINPIVSEAGNIGINNQLRVSFTRAATNQTQAAMTSSVSVQAANTQNFTGAIGSALTGVAASVIASNGATGTATNAVGVASSISLTSFTATNAYLFAGTNFQIGSGAITNAVGLALSSITAGTNNTYLLLGTTTPVAGNWGIHAVTGNNNYLGTGSTLIGTTTVAASSILTLASTTQGFLIPRMTGAQAEAIASPAEGLQVYATDGSGVTITSKGWWGFDGTNWVKLN